MKTVGRNPLPYFVLTASALFAILFLGAVAPAWGQDTAEPADATVSGVAGGINVPNAPRITDVICLTGCTKIRTGSPGGSVEITGQYLDAVEAVSFRTAQGRVRVRPDTLSASRVTATVPDKAVTGTLIVIGIAGAKSNQSPVRLTVGPALRPQGKIRVVDASSSPRKAFQYGVKRPTLRFILAGRAAKTDLRIDLVNARGSAVQSFFRKQVRVGSPQTLAWGGKVRGGKQAPNGGYRFVIRNADGSEAALSQRLTRLSRKARTSAANPFGFRMYQYIFPLAGRHQFWGGIGDGRGHQGIDIGARCGMPIRAARAGTVYWNDYQAGGAGNYLVINTTGTGGRSQVYMHMPRRSAFRKGAKVKTGQVIGRVGSTGRSSGCHLHFEEWSGPGWYQGGTFLNPLARLKAWDRYS